VLDRGLRAGACFWRSSAAAAGSLEWQPCTALLGSLYCILHYIPAPFVLQMHCVATTEGGSGRPDPGHGHAGPRSCSGRQAAGLCKLSGAVFAWSDLLAWRRINVRDERTRRRVAPGKTAASQARRNAPAARQGRSKYAHRARILSKAG